MEKVSEDKKRLRSMVSELQKCVECPVCLETVKHPFKSCVRGHCACLACVQHFEKCLICQEPFVMENLVCVSSMIERLPHFCCYSDAGCDDVVEPGNDHEMFCGFRPIVCRSNVCSVKVPLVNYLDHCKTHNSSWLIKSKATRVTWKVSPNSAKSSYMPIFLFDNLFWVYMVNNVTKKQFHIFFQATPVGKLEHDYYVRIKFKRDQLVFTYSLKAQVLGSCEGKFEGTNDKELDEEYCMKIPQKELHNFIDDDKGLSFSLNVFEV